MCVWWSGVRWQWEAFQRNNSWNVCHFPSLTSLTPSPQIKFISCFKFIFIISSRGFQTSLSCPSSFHPSIPPNSCPFYPSKPALSSFLVWNRTLIWDWMVKGHIRGLSKSHSVSGFRGGNGSSEDRRDASIMNYRTLSSSLLCTYDPQHSMDQFLTSIICVDLYASVYVQTRGLIFMDPWQRNRYDMMGS